MVYSIHTGIPLPIGTVTFLFTDIVGSTPLWESHPEQMAQALQTHNTALRQAIEDNHGVVFKTVGDAFQAAFATASDGLKAAVDGQRALQSAAWNDLGELKVRMGLHTGEAELDPGGDEYVVSHTKNRIGRIHSVAHGGQILLSVETYELVKHLLPSEVTFKDLGEHHLKGMKWLEHLFQLCAPGLPQEFPPLPSALVYRHNLPLQSITFIGREKEMTEIKQAIADHRLVTLTGPGGVGKTSLSIQIALDLLDQFPSGTWFVELASITEPNLIPQTILSAAEIPILPGKTALDGLRDFLGQKTSLLILDNCEHLIEACANLANSLLDFSPNLKILASSREALGIPGEQIWRVPSLTTPDIKNLPPVASLSHYEAVRLFIDRAGLILPHFKVTNENAPAIAQICYRLEGIPLAIELAVSRLSILSPEQIASRLEDSFRLLTSGSRTAMPRHQTLWALIDWSYSLLSENERKLFQRLSVFADGWTLEAAEKVCADPKKGTILTDEILDLLAQLVDKSLVLTERQEGPLARYRLLESLRQYAQVKLDQSGEREIFRNQHLEYYLIYAEEAEPHLHREEQLEWFDRLEENRDNLRTALMWAAHQEYHGNPENSLRLANALWWFWHVRGEWIEGREWYSRLLGKSEHPNPTLTRARALHCASRLFSMEDKEQGRKFLDDSLALYRELNDKPGIASCLCSKGNDVMLDDIPAAKIYLEESLSLYQELENQRGIASVFYQLGKLSYWKNDPQAERSFYEKALKINQEIGDRRGAGYVLNNLGLVYIDQGDWTAAHTFFEQSLSLGRELKDKYSITMWLENLAMTDLNQGDPFQAQVLIEESLTISQDLGDKYQIASAHLIRGTIARFQSNYALAGKLYGDSLSYFRSAGDKNKYAMSLFYSGELARLEGNYHRAGSLDLDGLEISREIDNRGLIVYFLFECAALSAANGNSKQAAKMFAAAEALNKTFNPVLWPVYRAEYDRNIAAVHAQLDEETFTSVWNEGQSTAWEQAAEKCLDFLQQLVSDNHASTTS